MIRDDRVNIAVAEIDCRSVVDIERGEIAKSSGFISEEVLFAEEVSPASFDLRASESPASTGMSGFSLVLTIAGKEIMESSPSAGGSRVSSITTIFNNDDVTAAGLVESSGPFSSLDVLLLSLGDTSNRVISSVEGSGAMSARRVLYNIEKAFCDNKSTPLRSS